MKCEMKKVLLFIVSGIFLIASGLSVLWYLEAWPAMVLALGIMAVEAILLWKSSKA